MCKKIFAVFLVISLSFSYFTFSDAGSVNRHIFTGKEHDGRTGLVYFGKRYYDPETGRFTTQDPYLGEISRPPSRHRYNYVKSNPTSFVDKNGYDYAEVQDSKAYWVIEKDIAGPFNPDMRRVNIGYIKKQDPGNVYLTAEFGDGRVGLKKLKQGASSYWGRYDVEEFKSVFNPADISSLNSSLQNQLIRHHIHNRMDPHNQGGIYADRPRFRSKTTRNLDRIQTAGDFAGLAPGVGNFVDAPNTVLYGLRGKWDEFGFGVAAMLPVVGQGSTVAKYGKKGGKFIDEGIEVADDFVTFHKAPRKNQVNIVNEHGYRGSDYPGEGAYFTTNPKIAAEYAKSYGKGVHEINVPRNIVDKITTNKGIVKDGLEVDSFIVRPNVLDELSNSATITHHPPNSWELYDKYGVY